MLKTLIIATTLALVIAIAAPGTVAEPNELQSGDNGLCEDYNVLYEVPGVTSPLAPLVVVEGGSNFTATQDGGAVVTIDFFDASGTWIDFNSAGAGEVPPQATYGVVCVGLLDLYPDIPAIATWTYQDGFE